MGENGNPLDPTQQRDETADAAVSDPGIGAPPARSAPSSASPSASGSAPASLIGLTVSHYRILERLGGGGMGVVYKAWDVRLERHAALKFLSPHRSTSDDFKRRFAREARTASRLEHSNICTVFETDESEDGRLFIAMAFCEGESLKRKIERGPLPLAQALSLAAQVAAGLGAAHEKSIVHRDIKPGNIMVAADGKVKIVDFGIARLADQTRMTRTGDLMGTTAYVAPEQFVEEAADHRADLWSLGVVLYEMITGRLPWIATDDRELVNAIVKRQPRPLSALRLDVPQALERVVARVLAKRPAERYQRAEELRADLDEIAATVAPAAAAFPYEQTLVEVPHLPHPPGAAERGPGHAAPTGEDSRRSGANVGGGGSGIGAMGGVGGIGGVGAGLGPPGSGGGGGIASWSAQGPQGIERRPTAGPVGRMVGHYRILAPLGGGGMGIVYKAQDLSLERVVALKFLPPELTRDPEAKTRFLQEARAASALDHPNICTIFEVGETDDGQLYLAMACYEGETLKQRLQKGRLPIDEALETAQQVARGLVKAHRHGIVHRDIKPANIMITTDDIVKILDFGIAKLLGAAGLTRVGSSLGTPAYMSPEQARGEEIDPRADVWSLGAVLYEMVTGRRPFRGEHEQTVLYSLFNEEPEPVLQLRPDAPPELARIIGRMLAKDLELRYPTAAAALSDLRALYGPVTGTLTGSLTGVTALPPAPLKAAPTPRRRRLLMAGMITAALAALIAVLGAAAFLLRRQAAPTHPSFRRITDLEGKEEFPTLSPDGTYFTYAKTVSGRSHIFQQRVGGSIPTDLSRESTVDDTQPAYSPDGQLIAFRSERDGGGIFLMGATGESVRRLTNFGYNPAWSPNGGEIVFATEGVVDPMVRRDTHSEIWRVNVADGKRQRIFAGDGVQPAWSPDGRRIAFWGVVVSTSSARGLWTIPVSGGAPVPVFTDQYVNWDPVWSPDGKFLYFASNRSGSMNLWRVAIDEESGKLLGEPDSLGTPAQSSAFLSFSRDGRNFVYATEDSKSKIERIALDPQAGAVTGTAAAVIEGSKAVLTLDASPDGQWIVYSTIGLKEDIFVVHPDRSGWRQLTDDKFRNRLPRWSPDSSSIVFYSNRSGRLQAWTIHPDGSELQPVCSVADVYNPVLSPDGRRLACNAGPAGALALIDMTRPVALRRPEPVAAQEPDFSPFSWSPDGQRLVGLGDVPGIFTYSFPQRRYERITTDAAQSPSWLHDGKRVVYLRDGKVFIADADAHTSRPVLAPPESSIFVATCPSRDDRMLYTVRSIPEGHIFLGTFASIN